MAKTRIREMGKYDKVKVIFYQSQTGHNKFEEKTWLEKEFSS